MMMLLPFKYAVSAATDDDDDDDDDKRTNKILRKQ